MALYYITIQYMYFNMVFVIIIVTLSVTCIFFCHYTQCYTFFSVKQIGESITDNIQYIYIYILTVDQYNVVELFLEN